MSLISGINWQPALNAFFERVAKIKKTHRVLIVGGILLLLGGSFFWFVYMPKAEEINRIEKEIADLNQQIQVAKIRAKNLEKLKDEFAQIEKEFEKALKVLPNKREIPSLLASISQLGIDSKLQFRLFTPGEEEPMNFYVRIPVSIEVGGKYRDVAVFFDKVRQMQRIVNIRNITIDPKAPLSTDLITKCTATTYRFKESGDEPPPQKKK